MSESHMLFLLTVDVYFVMLPSARAGVLSLLL